MQRRIIDIHSERARFRQLADILRNRITVGEWEPGESLPSEAHLGHEYEISQATVRRALAVLRAEGLVESVSGMPWRVREQGEPSMVKLLPGDKVRARLSTKEDQEADENIPEGTIVLVVSRNGRERVYRASEVEGEVPALDGPGA